MDYSLIVATMIILAVLYRLGVLGLITVLLITALEVSSREVLLNTLKFEAKMSHLLNKKSGE